MKLLVEIDVPDDITAKDVQGLLQEFHWLVRLRGWRALLTLPLQNRHPRRNPRQRHAHKPLEVVRDEPRLP